MKILIFLGPTLPIGEARTLLDATYLPPIRQGELLSAVRRFRPDRVGIIDGVFLQDLAVWHKEILHTLESGVQVWGAASMGALRAAELARYGMRGVGHVFANFYSGQLTDDDEVAMAHGPAEFGYRKLSEPMVNIRATLQAAECCGSLTTAQAEHACDLCKQMYFPERSFAALYNSLHREGMPADAVDRHRHAIQSNYVDQKKDDALELLQQIQLPSHENFLPGCHSTAPSDALRLLMHCDRKVERQGTAVSLAAIARFAALHQSGIDRDFGGAVDEQLANLLASLLGIIPTHEQVETEARAFWLTIGIVTAHEQQQWALANDLLPADLERLHLERATRNRLRRWWLTNAGGRPQKAQLLLDTLHRADHYVAIADRAAHQQAALEQKGVDLSTILLSELSLRDLYRRHAHRTGATISGRLTDWIADAGFSNPDDFLLELLRADQASSDAIDLSDSAGQTKSRLPTD